MNLKPKINLEFLKNNKQLAFSVLVIILVPTLVVLNTWVLVNNMRRDMDQELRDKAIMAAQGLNVSLYDELEDIDSVKNRITEYGELTDNVTNLTIVEKIGEEFTVVASLNEEIVNTKIEGSEKTLYVLAWFEENPIANLKTFSKERYWAVTLPLKDTSGNKVYLANVWVSLADSDALMQRSVTNATMVLAITLLVIIVLIISNGRLFQYSILFQKLKEVDEMKDNFISIASHELRTPLTAIKGNLSMILEDMSEGRMSKKQKEEILEMTMASSDRLNTLVADILDVSRIEQNRMKLDVKKLNIVETVKPVIKNLQAQAKSNKLKLVEEYPKKYIFSDLDKAKFEQVIVNLVGNAIKYTEEGEVEIVVSEDENMNKIVIHDTGIGMDEEERKNLFSKFYRVKNEKTKEITGTGLGLWITKQLVETMKGKILVDSIKGVGSQFTITFPKSEEK